MKEYIEKEKVMETITNLQGNININRRDLYNVIDSLPTTNNQYEVGGIYEFSNDGEKWEIGIFEGFSKLVKQYISVSFNFIRPLSEESNDIKQLRKQADKLGFELTPKK